MSKFVINFVRDSTHEDGESFDMEGYEKKKQESLQIKFNRDIPGLLCFFFSHWIQLFAVPLSIKLFFCFSLHEST